MDPNIHGAKAEDPTFRESSSIAPAGATAGVSASQSAEAQYMIYMQIIFDLYNKTTPYTEEDYQKLIAAMTGIEKLLDQDPPPDDLTQEMRYNMQTTIYLLNQAGIYTSETMSPEEQIAAMNKWATQSITILSWTDATEITSDQFMQGIMTLTGIEHGTFWLIELAFADTSDEYATQLGLLGEAMQITNALLEELTTLYELMNYVEVGSIPAWDFPPIDANAFPPPDSEAWDDLMDLFADIDKQIEDIYIYDPVTGQTFPAKYPEGHPEEGEWMYPDQVLRYCLELDYARAEAMVAENPGMTMEEALAQQTLTANAFKEYMTYLDPDTSMNEAMEILMDYHFEYNNVPLSTDLLNELYVQLEETMNDLNDLLNQLDPTGELRNETDSLPYFIDQILKEYNEILMEYPNDPAQIMWHWIEMCAGQGEEGAGSMTKFYVDMAISSSQSLSGDQKTELEKIMKLFQMVLTALADLQKSMTKTMTSAVPHA